MNHPLIIATIAADQLSEHHERAARIRTARALRRAKQRGAATGRSRGPLFPHLPRALRPAA
jgi:hypothetical protein